MNKNDVMARRLLGDAYGDIPKSVFALVAYHFASQIGTAEYFELQNIASEIEALEANGIIDTAQARRCLKAIAREVCS